MKRHLLAALVLTCVAALGLAATADAAQPIEGTWNFGGGQVLVKAQSGGSFTGVVVQPVQFSDCTHPVGQTIWTIHGSGLRYTGQHVWFKRNCGSRPGGESTWHIDNTNPSQYSLTFCTAYPGTGAPDPAANPGHAVGSTQCFELTRAQAPGQAPATPVNKTRPVISGTPAAGHTLTCSTGTWTNSPTAYNYTWARNGTPIAGATSSTYKVATGDEGLTLTCSVTAFNGGGAGAPATSNGVKITVPSVAGCPRATGRLAGVRLGLVRLGMTRVQARKAYTKSSTRGRRYEDFFCLTPIGVRVGYASPKLLRALPKSKRHALAGRVVWASTSNAYYAVHRIRAGATLAAAKKKLHLGKPLHIGLNFWYLAPNGKSTAVLKVRHGIVDEIGIGSKQLTRGRKAQRVFMSSFY